MSAHPVEVFYSYAHEDATLRNELEKHLSILHRQGIISSWHDRQIEPGTDWAKDINTHLETASLILLLVSSDFLASDYCYGIEMKRALERDAANEARVIPIMLRPVDWHGSPFERLQALPTDAKPVTKWPNQDEAFADIATGIRRAIEDLPQLAVSAPSALLPPIWNILYPRNPVFTGREEILQRIQDQLQAGQAAALSQAQAISGLGGIGKTQIAVEFAYRHRSDYEVVLWALSDTRESLVSGYIAVAKLLNLPAKDAQDQAVIIEAVKHWLQTHGAFLLILDNADDLAMVREFVPSVFGGHILLTTRAQSMGRQAKRIEVETMDRDVGALFLLRRVGLVEENASLDTASANDVAVAHSITEELGGLPLALDQAGAFIEESQCSLQDYLERYRTRKAALLQRRGEGVTDHPEPVATTWSLSFERVEGKSPIAADLLRVCAFLAADSIDEEIILQGAAHLGSHLSKVSDDLLLLDEAVAALGAYSLIRRERSDRTLSVHRLVQAVLRDTMDGETRKQWAERAVLAVNETFPSVEFATWAQCERYLPHALVCAELIEQGQMRSLEAAALLYRAGWYLDDRGRYSEAEPLYQRALSIREQALGADHPSTGTTLHALASLYQDQGKYTEAESLYQRALRIKEQALGADHPHTAVSLHNLATLYESQGKYEEAEPLFRRALAIHEKAEGPNHPDTRGTRGWYVSLLRKLGRDKRLPWWRRWAMRGQSR
jgi:tetratricopeptide (TPR) repeat protein